MPVTLCQCFRFALARETLLEAPGLEQRQESLRGPSSSDQPIRNDRRRLHVREFEAVSSCGPSGWRNRFKAIRPAARSGSASALSTLFSTTIGRRPISPPWRSTKFLVCGIGPSAASTSRNNTVYHRRCVSTRHKSRRDRGCRHVIGVLLFQTTVSVFAKNRDAALSLQSLLSIARSVVAWFSRIVPDCFQKLVDQRRFAVVNVERLIAIFACPLGYAFAYGRGRARFSHRSIWASALRDTLQKASPKGCQASVLCGLSALSFAVRDSPERSGS